jgi:hypothetical protein
MNKNSINKPIFIIGAQRSGTTLLRLLLNASDEIAIPEEGTFFMPLLRKDINKKLSKSEINNFFSYLDGNTQFELWDVDIDTVKAKILKNELYVSDLMHILYGIYAEKERKEKWGDKTPSFFRMVKQLSSLFPEAVFIHLVRDGRDLYLSWKKMDPTKGNPSVTAAEWYYKTKRARSDLKKYADGRYFEIKYEDLVGSTKASLKMICEFCDLHYSEGMLEFWLKSNNYIGNHHSNLIFSEVTTTSVQKWENVSENEMENIKYFDMDSLFERGCHNSRPKRDNVFVGDYLIGCIKVGRLCLEHLGRNSDVCTPPPGLLRVIESFNLEN